MVLKRTVLLLCLALLAVTGCKKEENIADESQQVEDKMESKNMDKSEKEGAFLIGLEASTFGLQGRFPSLLIHIKRDGHDEGSVLVRFPEMIEAWSPSAGKLLKFYQDNRDPAWPVDLECEPLNLPVDWQGDEKELTYTMQFDNKMTLTSQARVVGSEVFLSHTLYNGSGIDLEGLKMWNCVQLVQVPNLNDPLMERTALKVDGKFKLFRDTTPGFTPHQKSGAALRRFSAYMKGCARRHEENPFIAPHPGFPDDPSQSIYFWQAEPTIDAAVIATVSNDNSWGVATFSDKADNIWTNPGISCHHSDPSIASCPAGSTVVISNQLLFFEGNLTNLEQITLP